MAETTKQKELVARAKTRAREKGCPFTVALVEVSKEDPALAYAAREEALGRKFRVSTLGNGQRIVDIDLGQTLVGMAHARAQEKNISYAMALSEIRKEVPEIAEAYRKQVLGCEV